MITELIRFAIYFIEIFMMLLYWCVFIWVILSWFASTKNHLGQKLEMIVRPIFRPFRWARIGMIDLSPLVALLVIRYAADIMIQFLATLA